MLNILESSVVSFRWLLKIAKKNSWKMRVKTLVEARLFSVKRWFKTILISENGSTLPFILPLQNHKNKKEFKYHPDRRTVCGHLTTIYMKYNHLILLYYYHLCIWSMYKLFFWHNIDPTLSLGHEMWGICIISPMNAWSI